jgi:ribosomal protein S18 acetylase RimI-like enzyme
LTDFTIRRALPSDAATIAEFNQALARETEHRELDPARLLPGVRAVLADSAKGFYTVAESAGEILGQMMITFEWSDWRNGTFWWIQSVYVRPASRGLGVYSRLHGFIENQARQDPTVCGLRLYVEGENSRAQRTYERMGMRITSYKLYELDFVG